MSQSNYSYSQDTESEENYASHNTSCNYSYESSNKNSRATTPSLNNQSEYESDLNNVDWENLNELIENGNIEIFTSRGSSHKYEESIQNSENGSNSSSIVIKNNASLVQKDDAQVFVKSEEENEENKFDDFEISKITDKLDKNETLWNIQSKRLLESETKNKLGNKLKPAQKVYATRNIAFGNYQKNKDLIDYRFNQKIPQSTNSTNKAVKLTDKNFVEVNKKDFGANKKKNYMAIMIEKPEFRQNWAAQMDDATKNIYENKNLPTDLPKTGQSVDMNNEGDFKNLINTENQNNLLHSTEKFHQQEKLNNLKYFNENLRIKILKNQKINLSHENINELKNYTPSNNFISGSYEAIASRQICDKCNELHDNKCTKICNSTEPKFKPYTLKDYKQIKDMKTLGGLGPNIGTNNWQEKSNNLNKLKKYGLEANLQNLKIMKKSDKPIILDPKINVDAHNRRVAALMYAKNIPLPRKTNYHNKINVEADDQESKRDSTVLNELKERHIKEKEIVEKLQHKLHL